MNHCHSPRQFGCSRCNVVFAKLCYHHIPWFNLKRVNKDSMMQKEPADDLPYNTGQHE